ncbi:MAG: MASE3 domain-containing protein, partial [Desulfurivibrionaceae bacterium]
LHLLAYKGIGVFPDSGANLPTQLWIAARYFESVSLLIAPSFLGRKFPHNLLFLSLAAVAALLLFSIFFWRIFPDCYLSGSGLTPFKIISEYVISAFLLTACLRIWLRRNQFERDVFLLALISIVLTACAEITFTAYLSVYGPANLIGHLLKIISFYLLYRAIIVTGLRRPHALLFRDLDKKRQKLQEVNRQLTGEISERVKVEREKNELISELQQALIEIKTLRGILPICSFCKKIRDDEGYWSQVEVYVANHSEADFSHSVCPACLEQHYKDYL